MIKQISRSIHSWNFFRGGGLLPIMPPPIYITDTSYWCYNNIPTWQIIHVVKFWNQYNTKWGTGIDYNILQHSVRTPLYRAPDYTVGGTHVARPAKSWYFHIIGFGSINRFPKYQCRRDPVSMFLSKKKFAL